MRKVVRKSRVRELTGLSDSTIYRKELSGDFPARVQLGQNSVGWFEDEVLCWTEGRQRGMAAAPSEAIAARRATRAATA